MTEMIERVALAIWQAREMQFPERTRRMRPDEIDKTTGAWGSAVELARAAVEAMREPTDAMADDGYRALARGADAVWQAMIDKALAP